MPVSYIVRQDHNRSERRVVNWRRPLSSSLDATKTVTVWIRLKDLLMSGYDFERPFISQDAMQAYVATDQVAAQRYGKTVKATPLSNIEYKIRFDRLKRENNMKPPPSCGRIFPGYLVVRKLDTP